MRASLQSIFGLVLSFKTLNIYADVICNTNHPQDTSITSASEVAKRLQDIVQTPIEDLCNTGFSDTSFLTYRSASTVFTITRTNNTYTFDRCESHFDDIIRQCIAKQEFYGGTSLANGLLYEIYHEKSAHTDVLERALVNEHSIGGVGARAGKNTDKKKDKKKDKNGANSIKVCSAKPKKGGRFLRRADANCENRSSLGVLYQSIPSYHKAMGESAYYFKVDPNKSDVWGTTQLYGCTGILISDPTFVIGKQGPFVLLSVMARQTGVSVKNELNCYCLSVYVSTQKTLLCASKHIFTCYLIN
jgi:hypothetical protein